MRHKLLIMMACVAFAYFTIPEPEVQAMEPVTIALLAPVAIKLAQFLAPYVIKGLKNLAMGFVDMGVEGISSFKILIGMGEVMFLSPFGYFYDGLRHMIEGGISACKFFMHTLLLPVRPFGAVF